MILELFCTAVGGSKAGCHRYISIVPMSCGIGGSRFDYRRVGQAGINIGDQDSGRRADIAKDVPHIYINGLVFKELLRSEVAELCQLYSPSAVEKL